MNQEHLAIATVPIQQWTKVLEPEEALFVGTIFPDLDKPFFVTEGMKPGTKTLSPEATMLKQIQEVSFTLDDLRLFLDTHPNDKNGLELMREMTRKRKALLKEFAIKYYPLTPDCVADVYEANPMSERNAWMEGPIPWEGACV